MKAIEVGDYEIRPIKLAVGKKGEPLFSECVTLIEIEDRVAGEFVTVTQQSNHGESNSQQILIDHAEWPALKDAIEMMLFECREAK